MIDKKPTGITGVVPIDAEHDLYAYQVNGRTIWAGSKAKCVYRFQLAGADWSDAEPPVESVHRAVRLLG